MSKPACEMVLKRKAGDTFTVTLKSEFAGRLELRGRRYEDLQSVGKVVRASLERKKIGADGLGKPGNPDAKSMWRALEDIRKQGRYAFTTLVSDRWYPDQALRLQNYLNNVLARAPAITTPVLQFTSPVDLPIDLMPALQPYHEKFHEGMGVTTLYELACTWFLGLQFEVHKILNGTDEDAPALIASRGDRVVLAPYWHRGLGDVNKLVQALRDLGFFEVLDPLPDNKITRWRHGEEAAERLVRGREAPEGPEGIVHIACHCDAHDALPPLDHCLRLAGRKSWGNELRVDVVSLRAEGRAVAQHGPVAVITACAASDVVYDSPVSIPDALLYVGFRSVVSPLVSVKVDPANLVTLYFYEALKRGMSIGAALVESRKRLLERYGHTLGLLHACYGDTQLRLDDEVVTRPHPDRMPV